MQFLSQSYAALLTKLNAICQLKRCQSILSYDQMVFMPKNSQTASERGAQLSALAELIHEKSTDKEIMNLIQQAKKDLLALEDNGTTTSLEDEARVLEIETKSFLELERVPASLAAKRAALSSKAHQAWATARTNNDFPSFEPVLKDCFQTAMEIADAKRGGEETTLYNQMLEEYETGMPVERIDEIFQRIQESLVPLISKVLASPYKPCTKPLHGHFPVEKQKEMGQKIVKAIGFHEDFGRIDVSVHPFTSSSSTYDVRITSRFSENEWKEGLIGTIHEAGHAIYEQNLKPSVLQIDSALSMGTHESQSLFWERHIGKSKEFWQWATPLLKASFEEEFESYSPEDFYEAINGVSPGFIRVEADELTYPLHVIVRYHIEKDVVDGKLDVKDIPKRWNDDMASFLNVVVPSDTLGCLQDVHWSAMAIGYFPTYLIGSSTAAQLAHYCAKDIPDMKELVAKGEFSTIREWLTDKVHCHGMRYKSLDDLLEAQLGEKLNPQYFIDYITDKYTTIYRC